MLYITFVRVCMFVCFSSFSCACTPDWIHSGDR